MGIRETLNQKPGITTGATAGIILVALGIIVWQLVGTGSSTTGGGTGKLYFSDDDGKSWFADDAAKLPPFDHNGKPAYEAAVYTCDGGKTKYVAFLRRYTEDAKKKITEAHAKANPSGPPDPAAQMAQATGAEVKLPGTGDDAKNWVKQTDPNFSKIADAHCKDGKSEPEPVYP
jgi:hypothetical protein